MKLSLNKCLNELDKIIFHDYKEDIEIRFILDNTRKYIIESIKDDDKQNKYNRRSFIVLLQFINYLIQEASIITF